MSILGGDSTTSTGGSIGIETGHSTGTYENVYMSLFVYVYVCVCMYVGNVIECMCEHCLFGYMCIFIYVYINIHICQ